jgi:hypothetical protein
MLEPHDLPHLVHQFELGIGHDCLKSSSALALGARPASTFVLTVFILLHSVIRDDNRSASQFNVFRLIST